MSARVSRVLMAFAAFAALASTGCGGRPSEGAKVRVTAIAGNVRVVGKSGAATVAPKASQLLSGGDVVETGPRSEAVIEAAGYVSYVREESRASYVSPPPNAPGAPPMRIELMQGLATFLVPRAEEARDYRFEAATHTVIAAVRGTKFTVSASEESSVVTVLAGRVDLLAPAGRAVLGTLAGGERATVKDSVESKKLSAAEAKEENGRLTAIGLVLEALRTGVTVGTY